jgi:thiosulfate dehydrogenase
MTEQRIAKHILAGGCFVLAVVMMSMAGCHKPAASTSTTSSAASTESQAEQMPALAREGKLIFDATPRYASAYVGNKLACSDCHIKSGTADYAAPMIDLAGLFPLYSKRAGREISLEERIQECFVRSENGKPLPDYSKEMQALVAYINWLSRDEVKGKAYEGRGLANLPALTGHTDAGKQIYTEQCAACHGKHGTGAIPILPPLWGRNSYNDGAGMDKPAKMAAFVSVNMPQNHPGTLSPQQAFDVSAYIHAMPRPKFNKAYKKY